jgi:hypothetical protein
MEVSDVSDDELWRVCRKLPSDFEPYDERKREFQPDCSTCLWFQPLLRPGQLDWGTCANPHSTRAGLLTFCDSPAGQRAELGRRFLAADGYGGRRGAGAKRLTVIRKELEQRLVERWPSWFKVNGSTFETRMVDGFVHGDGWFNIVWKLCEDLEPLAGEAEKATGRSFEVLQVKQKFGGLRFYVNHGTDATRKRIEAAQLEALRSCEVCGQPGKAREGDWIRAVCDEHASV